MCASALVEDGVVASLLLIHGLYPVALETRVREALEAVRPYMESHGGDVELLGSRTAWRGCALTGTATAARRRRRRWSWRSSEALEETAPDLPGLEVEGVVEPPRRRPPAPSCRCRHGRRRRGAGARTAARAMPPGRRSAPRRRRARCAVEVGGTALVVANVGGTLLAYRNACAGCGGALDARRC